MDEEDETGADDRYPGGLKPVWRRAHRRDHEINVLLAGLFGFILGVLLMYRLLKP